MRGFWHGLAVRRLLTMLLVCFLWSSFDERVAAQSLLSGNFAQWTDPYNNGSNSIPGDPDDDRVDLAQAQGQTGSFYTSLVTAQRLYFRDTACAQGQSCSGSGRSTFFYAAPVPDAASGKQLRWQINGSIQLYPDAVLEIALLRNHVTVVARFVVNQVTLPFFSERLTFFALVANDGTVLSQLIGSGSGLTFEALAPIGSAAPFEVTFSGGSLSGTLAEAIEPGDGLALAFSYISPNASTSTLQLQTLDLSIQ
jgi:hypothetical protein